MANVQGTTPYTHSNPGTPINMPWLNSTQTGRGAAVVSCLLQNNYWFILLMGNFHGFNNMTCIGDLGGSSLCQLLYLFLHWAELLPPMEEKGKYSSVLLTIILMPQALQLENGQSCFSISPFCRLGYSIPFAIISPLSVRHPWFWSSDIWGGCHATENILKHVALYSSWCSNSGESFSFNFPICL